MKKTILTVFVASVLSLLAGCTHYYYAPNSANIPLFKEKNNFKFKAGYGGDDYKSGDIQMAYSASRNVGIMVNSFLAGKTEDVEDSYRTGASHQESGKGSYIEGGAGYYKPFSRKKVWIFEAYGGVGIGGENHTYGNLETSKFKLTKYFVQPSIGYSSKSGKFEFAVSSRFSRLNLKIDQSNVTTETNKVEKQNVDLIALHPSSFLWEPSFMIAGGWPNFKFFLQLTSSDNLSNSHLFMDKDNVTFGLKFTLKNNPGNKSDTKSNYISPFN
jgi:hypothetical protein